VERDECWDGTNVERDECWDGTNVGTRMWGRHECGECGGECGDRGECGMWGQTGVSPLFLREEWGQSRLSPHCRPGLPSQGSVECLDCIVVNLLLLHGCGRSVRPLCNFDCEHKNRRKPFCLGRFL
jgi:hypothetical protein